MKKLIENIPFIAVTAFFVFNQTIGFETATIKAALLLLCAAGLGSVFYLRRSDRVSPIHKGMAAFLVLAVLAFWILPIGAARLMAGYPAAALYAILFLVAAVPPLIGREVFTLYFARKTTPEAVWETDVFKTINTHLTGFWAALFLCCMLLGIIPGFLGLSGPVYGITFEAALPAILMLGIGLPVTKHYPAYYQRKLGLTPVRQSAAPHEIEATARQNTENQSLGKYDQKILKEMEEPKMSENPTIVAVNGSPHAGAGNTSMMIEMLRGPLSEEGFDLEIITLSEKEIDYCYGCAFCMEKGKCWIEDDHHSIVKKLLSAEGVILGSPVYFLHVTAQMKTFLDRSLAYGHKPRPTWKPGLAVCVSAGLGETQTAEYLAGLLRVYGAFAVGKLTAMATGPGQFVGKEAVEARAHDLARDLARAIKEKRRRPATDTDLRFYQFMGNLVKNNKESVMRDDHKHWQTHGLYEGFEKYIQQATAKTSTNPEIRNAWIKELIAQHKKKKKGPKMSNPKETAHRGPQTAKTCAELLQMMPLGFKAPEADGLEAIYQFEISGAEDFTAHLNISAGKCSYHDGPAEKPGVIIKSPSDVWLAVSKGSLDGQQAFMNGQYQVEGDLNLLMKLRSLFPG